MSPAGPTPAEQHLGDRLAALVDGELGHDARERVLAHLATCPKCKAEADAQRRLKSVFASTAPPPPSEGLLARLQGLPGGPGDAGGDDRRGPFDDLFRLGGSGPGGSGGSGGLGGVKSDGFATAAAVSPHSGFRIHAVGGRSDHDRSPWRGRRFGIAAASAVSFAAIALGGALPLESTVNVGARGEGTGSNVTPLRSPAGGAAATGSITGTGSGSGTGTGTTAGATTGRGGRTEGRRAPDSSATPLGVGSTTGIVAAGPLVPCGVTPAVAVQLKGASAQSAVELSPFVRPTGPALSLAFPSGFTTPGGPAVTPAPSPFAAAGPTPAPLTSPC
ncbi:zf-HC2 domain-containing protein [Streptomyces sp. Je 1-79]|uniref:anti-sigma factor family protein n=1 Tax=Streptomyces sp. Je 1-79 TaxID=2943847 RepID=UPI0021A6385E|nr:zf-HC2 domain-containing protein [Streptomyces sp. Je 1-79]MCT4355442.1 zf-HC2 domain-containing protein [Streptomyces sp. Je 1-79]